MTKLIVLLSRCVITDTPEKLAADWELKWFREELVKSRDNNGVGLQNVPGNDEDGKACPDIIKARWLISLYSIVSLQYHYLGRELHTLEKFS